MKKKTWDVKYGDYDMLVREESVAFLSKRVVRLLIPRAVFEILLVSWKLNSPIMSDVIARYGVDRESGKLKSGPVT